MPIKRRSKCEWGARCLSTMFVVAGALAAQQAPPPAGLTITQAVEGALRNYPSIRVSQEQINAAARKHSIQAVLGTSCFYMVTRNCSIPSVFWGDTTVAGVLDKYPHYKNLTKRSLKDCHDLEQRALSTSSLAVFSNQWAADVACASYSFDERKVRVIPYGANLFNGLDADDIAECLRRRNTRECELLSYFNKNREPGQRHLASRSRFKSPACALHRCSTSGKGYPTPASPPG